MDFVPVIEPAWMSPVKFHRALRLVADGQCAIVRDAAGNEIGLRWLFSSLDTAVNTDDGRIGKHSAGGRVTFEVQPWDGNDPNLDMPVLQQPCTGRYEFR